MDIVSQIVHEEAEFVNMPKSPVCRQTKSAKVAEKVTRNPVRRWSNLALDQRLGFFVRF